MLFCFVLSGDLLASLSAKKGPNKRPSFEIKAKNVFINPFNLESEFMRTEQSSPILLINQISTYKT